MNIKQHLPILRLVLSGIVVAAMILCIVFGVQSVQTSSIQKQKASLTNAIQRDITSFYAINGTYPQSLDELMGTYPLQYDKSTFFVDYQPVSANLPPDITILTR